MNLSAGLPFHVQAQKEGLLFELRTWPSALDTLLDRIPYTAECARRITLMKMNYFSTFINISTLSQPCGTEKYRELTPIFRQILDLAKILLCPATAESRADLMRAILVNSWETDSGDLRLFAFVAGVIQPLHMVADKCVDVTLCEEALELLEDMPWREGAWDSAVMASIARRRLRQRDATDL